ncbi:hypothetical protein [Pedobacter sp.]|uniref:hypothetical protein n=1 Tax=Pedobacter sp. TaxID=1411316 RepID=UPI00396C4B48
MKAQFYILLSQRGRRGFEPYGQYFLGNDGNAANSIFDKLKGNDDLKNEALLHFDLMEVVDEIPMKVRMLCCTLEEYAYNCKVITKEIFKHFNLDYKD